MDGFHAFMICLVYGNLIKRRSWQFVIWISNGQPMPKYWLISDRDGQGTGQRRNDKGLTFWVSDGGPLDKITNWHNLSAPEFQTLLRAATDQFPPDKGSL